MIPPLQTKTADTVHTGIFASVTIFGWGLGTRLINMGKITTEKLQKIMSTFSFH